MAGDESEQRRVASITAALRAASAPSAPRVALVLGSGLGALAARCEDARVVPFRDLPEMPQPAVAGHAGNFVLGRLGDTPVVAMQGRAHLYEGHSPAAVVRGVRAMRSLGAEAIILTNAAGAIRPDLDAGDLMGITDQLNLTGVSGADAAASSPFGPRFVDMQGAFDPALLALATDAAQGSLALGVYAGVRGPAYETPAEARMLRTLGADAVGMSTVLEVIAARQMGARVLGLSCITNRAGGSTGGGVPGGEALDHAEVERIAGHATARLGALVEAVITRLGAGEAAER
ncbi:MAG: purine-nucleoside phosphorylase [Myxococcales bacterium]|nr:purine-nucleoside phosphorylase [Myxococcales bacterium]